MQTSIQEEPPLPDPGLFFHLINMSRQIATIIYAILLFRYIVQQDFFKPHGILIGLITSIILIATLFI